jgi:hypothetical protein
MWRSLQQALEDRRQAQLHKEFRSEAFYRTSSSYDGNVTSLIAKYQGRGMDFAWTGKPYYDSVIQAAVRHSDSSAVELVAAVPGAIDFWRRRRGAPDPQELAVYTLQYFGESYVRVNPDKEAQAVRYFEENASKVRVLMKTSTCFVGAKVSKAAKNMVKAAEAPRVVLDSHWVAGCETVREGNDPTVAHPHHVKLAKELCCEVLALSEGLPPACEASRSELGTAPAFENDAEGGPFW